MKKPKKPRKEFWEMTAKELQAATKEFDRPVPVSKTRALTSAERKQWDRIRKGQDVSLYIKPIAAPTN